MKKYLAIVVVLMVLVEAYGYIQNPAACKKLWHDLDADMPAILIPTEATKQAFGNAVSTHGTSLLTWVTAGGSTNSASATEPDAATNGPGTTLPSPSMSPSTSTNTATAPPPESATNSLAPSSSAASALAPNSTPPALPTPTLPPPTQDQLAALAAWKEPGTIPSNSGWTWTTSKGVFHDVQIVRVEADAVTIIHHDGGALVPISELPGELQRQLNYNPDAAAAAASKREADDLASQQAMAKERGAQAGGGSASDYKGALAQAKASGKLVMLHFTGSDWCPYCKVMESEVLSTQTFGDYAEPKYVFLTLDFPRTTAQAAAVKQQNQALAQKYGVQGYPTLVVIDSNEKELGRISGYEPGSGPGAVITQLKAFTH